MRRRHPFVGAIAAGALLLRCIVGCGSDPPIDAGAPDATGDVATDTFFPDTKLPDTSGDSIAYEAGDAPGTDAPGADTADGVVEADATLDAGPDSGCMYLGGQCNTLPSTNPVSIGCVQTAPNPTGGQIADGYYELTKADYVAAALDGGGCFQNQTRHGTIEICANKLLWLECDTVNSCYRGNNTISTMNTTMTLTAICSGNGSIALDYSVSGNDLVIYFQYPMGALILMTYARK